jgi:hypothetical protein
LAPSDAHKDGTSSSSAREESPVAAEPSKSTDIPLLVVEKTDDQPVYGEDFGGDATRSQKVAHDMRAADALPDKVIITPDYQSEQGSEEEAATPLFRHETSMVDQSPPTSATNNTDELSTLSTGDQTSSEDAIDTPSDPDASDYDDDQDINPLLSHEADGIEPHNELGSDLRLPHELGSEEEGDDELSNGPLLSHETWQNGDTGSYDDDEDDEDEDGDELDAAPLLSHETGSSSYKGSEIVTNSEVNSSYGGSQTRSIEPDEAPTFTRSGDEDEDDYEEDDAPLLPHERGSAVNDHSSADEDGPFMMHKQGTFSHDTDGAQALFGGSGRPGIFRQRTNSSSLPHWLPHTDAEDENLLDPSLERFPTNYDRILDRVATIGIHLPEDQTMEDSLHSPVGSVLSQACSSIDLVPVKSYTSLASVPEADYSDEDEDEDEAVDDMASLPSPLAMSLRRVGFARDPHATPMSDDSKRLELTHNNVKEASAAHSKESSEAQSVGKNDGATDTLPRAALDAIATPASIFNPITPPRTPEKQDSNANVSESHLRHRQVPKDDAPAPLDGQDEHDSPTPAKEQHLGASDDTLFRDVVTAYAGDRMRTG